ncbi:MAG TPA: alpha-hydroxy acid oxidase [Thermoplasmata archaeon]|nr:alpha-hydroxy acid oxidase [Thermoplasmata archaeon]
MSLFLDGNRGNGYATPVYRDVVNFQFTNLLELEDLARAKVPHPSFEYIVGGAEDEVSLRRNREAYDRWALRPRVLVDVSKRDTSTTVLGESVSMPILVAPTAFHCLVHPEGEVATARGAAAANTLMVASTISTKTLEEIADSVAAPRWFQLYVYRDRKVTEDLVDRAVRAGYRAICLTVDTPLLGRRERDERNRFTLPSGLDLANLRPAGLDGLPDSERGSSFSRYVADLLDESVTWREVDWLKSRSPLPIVLKGVMTAEDAAIAAEHGVDGIVVSNHGGRQLDSTLGTLDALPEVVAAVKGRTEVYVDGGIRRGTDVLKAIALGARAVLVGRPILWGLAIGGSDGVSAVLGHLRKELDIAMALTGRTTIKSIDRDLVARVGSVS